ncbi:NfeD family protein [Lachnospiraceae bacterium OttesenSCG-928-E19]|nr:NfeD family protein [Lachnospiraceae bacterium OttesenSCG-928-E19]
MDVTTTTVWIVLLIVFLVIEIATVGLTCIWFAGGALAGLIADMVGLGLPWQIVVSIVVTAVLLIFTRPFAMKHINQHHERTNYEGIIGTVVRITETVDNINQTGRTILNGAEWTVRATQDDIILKPGTIAKVVKIAGVKLIVEEYEEG